MHHQQVQFTNFIENYGSRLDRIYAADNFININVKPMTISDHHCVVAEIDLNISVKIGRSYWKLNTELLELDNIENDFKHLWNNLCKYKYQYININEWWELCAKVGIRIFFQKKGKEESQMRQGLVKYLEIKLHKLYKDMHATGILNMNEVKRLKDKLNNIKEMILEGVNIRARVLEQAEGEKASYTLLGKQSNNKSKPMISHIKTEQHINSFAPNIMLDNQLDISNYITKYYENIYSKKDTDKEKQEWFLSFVNKSITESDNENLLQEITEREIFNTMESFKLNKSPGLDGLPIEFYLKFFNIIKNEFCHIIKKYFLGHGLNESQRKALIVLIFKGGDSNLIIAWRPISMICVDAKII